MHFHWQNLNEKRGSEECGSGFRHGRCWWHFDSDYCDGRTIGFSWNFFTHFCMAGFDVDDDGITFSLAFPPVAFWLSFGSRFWLMRKWPRQPLSTNYPDTMVIDERECGIAIHGGRVWIKPWVTKDSWTKSDPWWKRGVSFSINPFEAKHVRHEVRSSMAWRNLRYFTATDGQYAWEPFVGSWERGKTPDNRELMHFPYTYTLKNGTIQTRTATVYVERRAWRPRCLQWTSLFEHEIKCIDVQFSDEVGERSGSWKGGTIGCSYEMLPGETAEQTLRRMEKERVFD